MVTTFNYYNDKLTELEGLSNEVTRGEIRKATALATIDEAITSNEITFASLQTYFAKEPGENAYNGALMLLGDHFNDNLNVANILAAVEEARKKLLDYPPCFACENHILDFRFYRSSSSNLVLDSTLV